MSFLDEIVERKRREVAALRPRLGELREAAASAAPARGFARALRRRDVAVVSEFKRRSPSAGWLRRDAQVEPVVSAYAGAGASALSVLTDGPGFGGTLEDLARARGAVDLPVLRKDFVLDEAQLWEARAAGADAALLIVRILGPAQLRELLAVAAAAGLDALVEVHDAAELTQALEAGAAVVGINNRDLASFRTDLSVGLELAERVPPGVVLVAESGIRGGEDAVRLAAAGFDAVLVGESLMRSGGPAAAVAALTGHRRRERGASGGGGAGGGGGGGVAVKICGVCRPEDAALAAEAGADYLGVIMAPDSPRYQEPESAARIYAAGGGLERVGVFVDAGLERVVALARRLALDVVQLHGAETPEDVAALQAQGSWRVWKAVRPRSGGEFRMAMERYAGVADAVLVDGWSAHAAGGVGARFPWAAVAEALPRPGQRPRLVMAGGLNPDNVARAVGTLSPDVVDVSSGVEAERGRKSPDLVRAFVAAARGAGQS